MHPSFTERHPCTNCRPCRSLIKHSMPCVVCAMPGSAMNAPLKTMSFHFSFGAFGIMASWPLFGDMCIKFIQKCHIFSKGLQKGETLLKGARWGPPLGFGKQLCNTMVLDATVVVCNWANAMLTAASLIWYTCVYIYIYVCVKLCE